MISYKDIREVHLEVSTLCNARCPWCPRNFWGYPLNGGYPETYLTLDQSKNIFTPQFLQQLEMMNINGNFGDIVMNPDGEQIVEYFRICNKNMQIKVSTNGGARKADFWKSLAKNRARIFFALDGLEDTHSLYRQDTLWATVIKNAKIFIEHNGEAVWQFIKFDHNKHQIDECRTMSNQLGFTEFYIVDGDRTNAPVFKKNGSFSHVIGNYTGNTDFNQLLHNKKHDEVLLEDITADRTEYKSLSCETINRKSIYVAANGDVSPCCYMGFYPSTYGKGQYHQAANKQLQPLIQQNNALAVPLEQSIEWFSNVEKSWKEKTYNNGRLVICDDNCGRKDTCKMQTV